MTVVTDFNPPELSAMGRRVNIPSRPNQIFAPPPIEEPSSQDLAPPAQAPAAPAPPVPAPKVEAPAPVPVASVPVPPPPLAAEEPPSIKGTPAALPSFNAMVEAMQNTSAPTPPPVKAPALPIPAVPKLKIVTATHQGSLGELPPLDDAPAAKPKAAQPVREPAMAGAFSPKLVQTAYVVALGELPPATPSSVDLDDDIIG